MQKVVKKLTEQMNALAIKAAIRNANSTCAWLDHQPKVPVEAKRLRKF